MYASRIVQRDLERLERHGIHLVYYSTVETDRWIAHLNSLRSWNEERGDWDILRPFSAEEEAFINNEILLCRIDFRYWVDRYAWITNEANKVVRFKLWKSQEILLDIIGEMEDREIAILVILLKARQLGMSRLISLLVLHRLNFFGHVNATMASSDAGKSRLLADMYEFVYENMPYWMQTAVVAQREGLLIEYETGSGVTIQHGAQTRGISRGTTPTVFHLTELAEFEKNGGDPASIVDSALLRAVHDNPNVLGFLEGTAEGEDNWWHNSWLIAKEGWPEGRSRLRPLFLPWFTGGLYPDEAWLRARPIPADYRPAPWAIKHKEMAEAFVRSTPYLRKHLGEDWSMSLEQMWFYEVERQQAIKKGSLKKFLQEMPANDDEAFQNTNISVFDTETIVHYRDGAMKRPLVGVYGLQGPSEIVPERLQPHPIQIDPSLEPIEIKAAWGTGYPIPLTMVPLRWDGWGLDDGQNKIYIWEKPEDRQLYGFGVDTSDGIDKDSSCIEGLRKGSPWEPGGQIAEFNSARLSALDVVPFCLALGTYYATRDEFGELKQPRFAIECRGNGDQTQNKLRLLGWRNFHPWQRLDNKKLDRSQYGKIGVFTNEWFRSSMIEYLVKMLRDQQLLISSKFFVKEMQGLQATEWTQSLKAGYGAHDDRIMAMGFILISLHQWDVPALNGGTAGVQAGALTTGAIERIQTIQQEAARNAPVRERTYPRWCYNQQESEFTGAMDEQWLQNINERAGRWQR